MNHNDAPEFFRTAFQLLTDRKPFPWQERAFELLIRGDMPERVDLPTGTGKTSLIPIWLCSLLFQSLDGRVTLPRRLVWVVNRRVVVDQATEEAQRLVERLASQVMKDHANSLSGISLAGPLGLPPIAVSTLRGQLADNGDWKLDPTRPAIIIGTVDMIGSRLLFSGYGDGKYKRPRHAGLLGRDAWVVLDEAHLTPAFAELLQAIHREQSAATNFPAWHFTFLSATLRGDGQAADLALSDKDREHPDIGRRLRAEKTLHIHPADEKTEDAEQIARYALAHKDARQRVLVFVKSPEMTKAVKSRIAKEHGESAIRLLTGTQRGFERDALAADPVFAGFRSDPKRQPPEKTHYLIATAAGEVGADLDADHLVCDLTPLDSMVQRLGRVNRLGLGAARVDLVLSSKKPKEEEQKRLGLTLDYLKARQPSLAPAALTELNTQVDAFNPAPETLPLTPQWLDMWSMTTISPKDWPDRPEVAPWLHGIKDDLPETWVAWREDVAWLGDPEKVSEADCTRVLDVFPLLPHERLREPTSRFWKADKGQPQTCPLLKLSQQRDNHGRPVLLLRSDGALAWRGGLGKLLEEAAKGKVSFAYATLLLPMQMGGLDTLGVFEPNASPPALDVAQHGAGSGRRRFHIRQEDGQWLASPGACPTPISAYTAPSRVELIVAIAKAEKLKLVTSVRLGQRDDESASEPGPIDELVYFADAARLADSNAKSFLAASAQPLPEHLQQVGETAGRLLEQCPITDDLRAELARALRLAGSGHDTGKARRCWQRAIGNQDFSQPLAKSGHDRFNQALNDGYRHEFGSLLDSAARIGQEEPLRDLILHLIASHHGYARPHFNAKAYDRETALKTCEQAALDAQRRFGHLQARYGWWGLAWLEAILKAADALVSAGIVKGNKP